MDNHSTSSCGGELVGEWVNHLNEEDVMATLKKLQKDRERARTPKEKKEAQEAIDKYFGYKTKKKS